MANIKKIEFPCRLLPAKEFALPDNDSFTRFVGSNELLQKTPFLSPTTPKSLEKFVAVFACLRILQQMIALLIYSLLFIFGLICALISTIPQTKKFLPPWLQSSHHHNIINTPQQQDPTGTTSTAGAGGRLRGVFATFDKNNDGYITKHELRESLEKIGIVAGERDVECMVEKVDSNGDGLVDYDEFCKLYESKEGGGEVEGGLREAFDVFDGNKDGLITVEELGLVLSSLGFSEGRKIEDCQEMIRKVDVDGDGMVNFDEFKKMMTNGTWKGD